LGAAGSTGRSPGMEASVSVLAVEVDKKGDESADGEAVVDELLEADKAEENEALPSVSGHENPDEGAGE